MGIVIEMCACPQQAIIPNSKLNLENEGVNLYNSNKSNIKNENNENNENNDNTGNNDNNDNNDNNIQQIKKRKKTSNGTKVNNDQNNDAETYKNISSNGAVGIILENKKETSISQKSKKKEEKRKKEIEKKISKKKSKKEESNDDLGNIIVSDTILSEISIPDKIKTISKEKKKKIKGRNNINIILIGYNEVGKSSFCIRLVENKFEDFYIPSICNENFSKIQVYNEHNYKVNFWVILGGAQIQKQDNVFNNADFFMLLYDITKIRSFNQLNVYIKQIRKLLFFYDKEGKSPNFFLVGNKSDLEMERKIGVDFINKCIQKNNIKHFDISIKTGKNINNLIQSFIQIFDKVAFSNK